MINTIKYAENWFRLQNIPTITQGDKMYISNGHFEFELSVEEIIKGRKALFSKNTVFTH